MRLRHVNRSQEGLRLMLLLLLLLLLLRVQSQPLRDGDRGM
jgi:hypothetical protein